MLTMVKRMLMSEPIMLCKYLKRYLILLNIDISWTAASLLLLNLHEKLKIYKFEQHTAILTTILLNNNDKYIKD